MASFLASNGYSVAKSWHYQENFPEMNSPNVETAKLNLKENKEATQCKNKHTGEDEGKRPLLCSDSSFESPTLSPTLTRQKRSGNNNKAKTTASEKLSSRCGSNLSANAHA